MMRYLISLCTVVAFACQAQLPDYDLNQPTDHKTLPKILNEISGLDLLNDSTLVSVQDEVGTLFFYNLNTKSISHTLAFKKHGDFEGVAKANGCFFALESNGTVYKILPSGEKTKFTFPEKGLEFEGLCFDEKNQRLILACKQDKGKDNHIKLFAFDVSKEHHLPKPILKMKKSEEHENFKPSGIAIHPNGGIYILSSVAKCLLQLSPEYKMVARSQLNPYVFQQPEGICFNTNGDLFISNEKHEGAPNLLKFKYLYAQ